MILAPVDGFLPSLFALLDVEKVPKPIKVTLSSFFKLLRMLSKTAFNVDVAVAFVTPAASAVEEIKNLFRNGNYSTNFGLRIGVEGGGCAGFSYILDFDVKKENDDVYYIGEIPLYIDNTQIMYLFNCNIDFKTG